MTDDNMNTADLVKRLRDWTEYDEGKVNDTRHEAADRIEQLEAELTRANAANDIWRKNSRETFEAMVAMRDSINEFVPMPSLESDLLQGPENSVFCATVAEAVITELTRANAATAAAYEVAAQIADDFVRMRERQIETEKSKSALHVDVPQIMRWQAGKVQSKAIAAAIRALATPDQTAALDTLVAEAVGPLLIAAKSGLRFIENTESELGIILGCGDSLRNALLAASKKGGV